MEWKILRTLDDTEVREILQAAVRRKYRDGDTLFHQGDPSDTVHLLERGHVAIKRLDLRGITLTLHVLGPGFAFGEQTLVEPHARRTASVVAIGAVETLMIRRDDFIDLQRQHPSVTNVVVEILAEQVRRLTDQLIDAHWMSAEDRVVKRLQILAAEFPVGDGATLPFTQEELASLAGTTRPTANRALQTLVDDGVVELGRGKIHIPDITRLPQH